MSGACSVGVMGAGAFIVRIGEILGSGIDGQYSAKTDGAEGIGGRLVGMGR